MGRGVACAEETVISVSQLTKAYGNVVAVDRVSFEVGKGQIVGFLGPNGAGKSTTLRMLTCYMPPTSGGATPMTYQTTAGGKQFLVIAAGGHAKVTEESQSDALVAFALP